MSSREEKLTDDELKTIALTFSSWIINSRDDIEINVEIVKKTHGIDRVCVTFWSDDLGQFGNSSLTIYRTTERSSAAAMQQMFAEFLAGDITEKVLYYKIKKERTE